MYDLTFCRCPTASHCYPCQGDSLVHSKGYDCTCSCHVCFHLGVQLTPPLFGYGTSYWGVFLHFHTCIYPIYQLDVGHSNFESASGVCAHGYVMVEKFTPCLSMPEAFGCLLVERHVKMKQSFPDEACCSFNEQTIDLFDQLCFLKCKLRPRLSLPFLS